MLLQASICLEAWDEALNEIIKLSYEMIQKVVYSEMGLDNHQIHIRQVRRW